MVKNVPRTQDPGILLHFQFLFQFIPTLSDWIFQRAFNEGVHYWFANRVGVVVFCLIALITNGLSQIANA